MANKVPIKYEHEYLLIVQLPFLCFAYNNILHRIVKTSFGIFLQWRDQCIRFVKSKRKVGYRVLQDVF